MNTLQEIESANALPEGRNIWLTVECRMCHESFGCFNRTAGSFERICFVCAQFGDEKKFAAAQLEALNEHPERFEEGSKEKLEAFLRGDIAFWELRV